MLCGEWPFKKDDEIVTADVDLCPRLSSECRDLLRKCLCVQPADRPSLEDILRHPWVTEEKSSFSDDKPVPRPCRLCKRSAALE